MQSESDAERPFKPPVPERLQLPGPVGELEALVEVPDAYDGRQCAVVCHPHPLYGGTMDNKVVHTLARALQERGFATVRFNFRGVGRSTGAYDDGRGETADAVSLCDWGLNRWPGARLTVAGFSFGSYVALGAALQRPAQQLITVAPPVKRFDFDALAVPACPWLVVQGDQDELVDYREVLHWTAVLVPPPTVVLLPGVEHFFHGRLGDLRTVIQQHLV